MQKRDLGRGGEEAGLEGRSSEHHAKGALGKENKNI